MYLQPSTTLQNNTPIRAGQNPESIAQEAISHRILNRQHFLRISSLASVLEIKRRCYSKVILESDDTHDISRSSDSFSTVPPIVSVGDWGCIVRDLETMIISVLLALNFIPKRSRHSLTCRGHGSGTLTTVTLTTEDGTADNKVESSG